MGEFQVIGELIKLVGFPGAICLLMIYLNKKQRDECRSDAKEDRALYMAERDRIYTQMREMHAENVLVLEKVVKSLDCCAEDKK